MGKIVKLDDHLSNMIAAGEVVERPSSVVKELVENALDAGSQNITINLLESGTKLIEVIDDGCGMSIDDARLCFTRHATSKIKNEYDLFRINTLGFRGEAIPSIASVSKFSLFTSDGETSININYNAGKFESEKPYAMNKGTKISVENLFFNVPARLKYLKSLKSELSSISYMVSKFILANPNVSFKLTNDSKVIYETSGNGDLIELFAKLYGLNVAKNLLTDDFETQGYKVSLVVAKNIISRSNKLEITVIVNDRFIKNRIVTEAIVEAYKTLIPEKRYPIALIKIDIDPLLIDVNVHPSKMVIKIANEKEMASILINRIRKLLNNNNLIPDVATNQGYKKPVLFNNSVKEKPEIEYVNENITQSNVDNNLDNKIDIDSILKNDTYLNNPYITNDFSKEKTESFQNPELKEPNSIMYNSKRLPELNYIGQIHGTYLIFESSDGMYIMDQHAAAERINYEYYYKCLANPTNESKQLLVSVNVELTNEEYNLLSDILPEFEKIGFVIKLSDKHICLINGIPLWLHLEDTDNIIHDLIANYNEFGIIDIMKYRDNVSKQISCKASIKANHVVSIEEIKVLVENLRKCNNPFTCPHGRPTIVRFTRLDLEKMFMRIM